MHSVIESVLEGYIAFLITYLVSNALLNYWVHCRFYRYFRISPLGKIDNKGEVKVIDKLMFNYLLEDRTVNRDPR
jgi:hypothetical protein